MFDLRSIVRTAVEDCGSPEPDIIVSLVMARIPKVHRDAALRLALRTFVRQVISEMRLRTTIDAPRESAKVAAIRADWRNQLRNLYEVTGNNRNPQWKRLANMTAADLRRAARARYAQADKNVAKAQYLERIADAVDLHEAAVVEDLPVPLLTDLLAPAVAA